MTGQTHLMAGLSTLWLFGAWPVLPPEQIALFAGAVALGSLLPDLDAAESKIKHLSIADIKPFYLPSRAIFHALGHRTLLHSLRGLIGVAVITVCLAALTPWSDGRVAVAVVAGYASHLALDACNPSGIPLLYPHRRKFHLLPKAWRIATGSPPEEIVFVLFALLSLLYFLSQLRVI